MSDDIMFMIFDEICKGFKIKNPYSRIIKACISFVIVTMITEFIINKLRKDDVTHYEDIHLYKKQCEFDKYYYQVRDKLPKIQIDPKVMNKFEKDCKELQNYIDELYTYLLEAYSASSVEEIDFTIESMKDLIKRLDNK